MTGEGKGRYGGVGNGSAQKQIQNETYLALWGRPWGLCTFLESSFREQHLRRR